MQQARSFLAQLRDRWETLRRVAEYTVLRQKDFLVDGPAALRPLTRAEVAAALDLHESTVSRAVADKYALLPVGRSSRCLTSSASAAGSTRSCENCWSRGTARCPTSASPICCATPDTRSLAGLSPSIGPGWVSPRCRCAEIRPPAGAIGRKIAFLVTPVRTEAPLPGTESVRYLSRLGDVIPGPVRVPVPAPADGGARSAGTRSWRHDTDSMVPSAASVTRAHPGGSGPRHLSLFTQPLGPALVVFT